ncbi:MAG: 4Fe-4S binding protein [Euryarchaeota archaeon]|nr:4Fe-4S binding protein [Euryarchaeota archaeon]
MLQDIRRLFLSAVFVTSVMYVTGGFSVAGYRFGDIFGVSDGFFRIYLPEIELLLLLAVFMGMSFGRLFCGWLCPLSAIFGFVEPLSKKRRWHGRVWFRLKYVSLAVAVVLVYYATTAGLPVPVGMIAYAGLAAVAVLVVLEVVYPRMFCTSLCPVGGFFSAVAKLAVFRLHVDEECTACGRCNEVCEMNVDICGRKRLNECSVCLACIEECPYRSISIRCSV